MIASEYDFWIFLVLVFTSTLACGLGLGFWIGFGHGERRTAKRFIEQQIQIRRGEVAARAEARRREAQRAAQDQDASYGVLDAGELL